MVMYLLCSYTYVHIATSSVACLLAVLTYNRHCKVLLILDRNQSEERTSLQTYYTWFASLLEYTTSLSFARPKAISNCYSVLFL